MSDPLVLVSGPDAAFVRDVIGQMAKANMAGATELVAVTWEPDRNLKTQQLWPDESGVLDRPWTHVVWCSTGNIYEGTKYRQWLDGCYEGEQEPFVVERSIWEATAQRHRLGSAVEPIGREAVLAGLADYLGEADDG